MNIGEGGGLVQYLVFSLFALKYLLFAITNNEEMKWNKNDGARVIPMEIGRGKKDGVCRDFETNTGATRIFSWVKTAYDKYIFLIFFYKTMNYDLYSYEVIFQTEFRQQNMICPW